MISLGKYLITLVKLTSKMKAYVSVSTTFSISKDMDLMIENPGLLHIGEKILKYLDFGTQSKCRLVNKSWKNLIEKRHFSFNIGSLIELLTNYGKFRIDNNPIYPMLKLRSDKIMWNELLNKLQSKLKSKWLYIYLHEFIQKRMLFSPIEEFTLVRNIKIIEFILQEKLYNFLQFNNALHMAAKSKDTNVMKYLLPYTFENVVTTGNLAAYWLVRRESLKSITLKTSLDCKLAVDKAGNNIIHIAAAKGDTELVKFFSRKQIRGGLQALYAENKIGQTPLFFAVINNNVDTVKIIKQKLSGQKIVNSKCGIHLNGTSVFHIAAQYGNEYFQTLKHLCSKVSDLNIKDGNGNLPIHLAAKTGNLKIVKFLASRTSNLDVENDYGETPAKMASSNRHNNVSRFLNRITKKRKFAEFLN